MQENEKPKKGKKRGPAPFSPTAQQRKDVTLYAAAGISEPGIAYEIGISQNTLRKHFAAELLAGNEIELAANLRHARKARAKGNVTAIKFLDSKFTVAGAAAAFQPDTSLDEPRVQPAPKIGKKEEATAAATTAGVGTEWGDDLKPPNGMPN